MATKSDSAKKKLERELAKANEAREKSEAKLQKVKEAQEKVEAERPSYAEAAAKVSSILLRRALDEKERALSTELFDKYEVQVKLVPFEIQRYQAAMDEGLDTVVASWRGGQLLLEDLVPAEPDAETVQFDYRAHP